MLKEQLLSRGTVLGLTIAKKRQMSCGLIWEMPNCSSAGSCDPVALCDLGPHVGTVSKWTLDFLQ